MWDEMFKYSNCHIIDIGWSFTKSGSFWNKNRIFLTLFPSVQSGKTPVSSHRYVTIARQTQIMIWFFRVYLTYFQLAYCLISHISTIKVLYEYWTLMVMTTDCIVEPHTYYWSWCHQSIIVTRKLMSVTLTNVTMQRPKIRSTSRNITQVRMLQNILIIWGPCSAAGFVKARYDRHKLVI